MGREWDKLKERARSFRQDSTDAENLLWERLRNRNLKKLKFRRQHSVGKFVLDFFCPALNLGIEVDGGVHAEQKDADAERTRILEAHGIRILRFTNEEVTNEIENVLQKIAEFIETLNSMP